MAYQDGTRGRSNLKDSYGNPVEYDTLETIDAKKPSKHPTNPNQFLIPGYASGILQPHEVPTRSNFNGETPRKLDDDRIHFVDPLQNAFQNTDKSFQAPSPSLSFPLGTNFNNQQAQTPINIPRPNIDLNETPQVSIEDPLNGPLSPPRENSPDTPSFALQVPHGNTPQTVAQDLTPPQIPQEGQSVFIPRPNLDIGETPIDDSNGPLNQGLLPPSSDGSAVKFDSNTPNFSGQAGPVVIPEGDVLFAPKPSNGLLPPKDPLPNEINFNPSTVATTTVNKFGGGSGVLGQVLTNVNNKFTGSFGGAPGILGGKIPASQSTANQIPVTLFHGPLPSSKPVQDPVPTQTVFISDPVQKYQGNFGGPPGVLTSDNQGEKASSTQTQLTVSLPSVAPTVAAVAQGNKFTGSFGGAQGILGGNSQFTPSVQTPTYQPTASTFTQLPDTNSRNDFTVSAKDSVAQKYTGQFGGAPGVLQAYDNASN